jgi:hypothetical protein
MVTNANDLDMLHTIQNQRDALYRSNKLVRYSDYYEHKFYLRWTIVRPNIPDDSGDYYRDNIFRVYDFINQHEGRVFFNDMHRLAFENKNTALLFRLAF